ncbi:hypothetical protein Ahy_A07g031787 [Arachis hypogaea]|uniref:CCHC-type domain-containing protein n=1 Tax=Arachis hypogaea TaxID=3818 RepID=A0A445C500_ARAHY|nr:hypothetical protein Ahy_A07g031787 [Arachis hypogaea]
MPPTYRRPSHQSVKKRRTSTKKEEQSSHTHLLMRGQIQRCSRCGAAGHKKGRCPKPIEQGMLAQPSKNLKQGKKKTTNTNSHPQAAKGGRKTASL